MKIGYTPVLAAFVSVFKLGGVHALYIIAYLVAEMILIGSQTFLSIFICNESVNLNFDSNISQGL